MDSLKEVQRERLAFVSGRLAAPALRDVLEDLAPRAGFDFEIVVLNIAVAALMTPPWAARRLQVPANVDRVILPGFCRGDLTPIENVTGLPVENGPKDLRELPEFFGDVRHQTDYGAHDIEIVAEINHVPQLTYDDVHAIASQYRDDGADIVDLGCDPEGPFEQLAEYVARLRQDGFRISVDSFHPDEILAGVGAGAELVLSVNSSNVEALRSINCEVVAIPDTPSDLDSLATTAQKLDAAGIRYRLDPILEPIGFGFAASLERYSEVRRRFPDAEMLMGVGNLTELTGVDTAAINTVLLGFCAELKIRSVLTTQVAPWTRTCVRELDLARRLAHYAVQKGQLPKRVEPRLHLLRDERLLRHGPERLEALASELKDRNYRIFAEDDAIVVMNSEGRQQGTDPFELFARLNVDDASHAFYLGYEMAKAVTALTLGKNYTQDQALRWGFLSREETPHQGRKES